MNVFQIMKQARYEVDAIRADGAVTGMWTDEEVLSSINVSMDQAARLLRLANSDILTKTLASTQATQIDLISELYDPTSMRIQPDVTTYNLPADFIRMASVRSVTAGFESVRWRPLGLSTTTFLEQASIPTTALTTAELGDSEYGYALIGPRTLRVVPTPKNTFDIEITYHYRTPKLVATNVGQAQRIGTSLFGTGTEWVSIGLRAPADIDITSAVFTDISLSSYYNRIVDFASNTLATLSRSYGTDALALNYKIGMVPLLPEEHHLWLAQLTAANMMRKVSLEVSDKMRQELEKQLMSAVQPEITVRQVQESLVVEPFELPWP